MPFSQWQHCSLGDHKKQVYLVKKGAEGIHVVATSNFWVTTPLTQPFIITVPVPKIPHSNSPVDYRIPISETTSFPYSFILQFYFCASTSARILFPSTTSSQVSSEPYSTTLLRNACVEKKGLSCIFFLSFEYIFSNCKAIPVCYSIITTSTTIASSTSISVFPAGRWTIVQCRPK